MNKLIACASFVLVACASSTPASVHVEPVASASTAATPPPATPVAHGPRHLFVGRAVGSMPRVCARRGDSLVCAPAAKDAPPDAIGYAGSLMHDCFWTKSGTAYCAGYNKDGRVGIGKKSDEEPMTLVPGVHDVVAMSLGARSTCAIAKDGTTWCWGDDKSVSPVAVPGVDHVVALSSGQEPHCFLRDDGSVMRSGFEKPPAPFGALSHVAWLGGCQPTAVCGVHDDGTPVCASTGELQKQFGITTTPLANLHVLQVASTAVAACALARDGSVHCWNDKGFGTSAGLAGAREIAAGDGALCSLMPNGTVACVSEDDPNGPARTILPP